MSTDVLRWPIVGRALAWRHARTSFQLVLLVVAALVVADGLFGSPNPTSNLAPLLTWVHYRGLLIVALLAAGNLFCTGCPFVLARDAGRRLHAPSRRWPRWLRTKWVGVTLFAAVLFVYELFDLWALPRGTAYLVLAYFAAALAVDLVFTGAAFCKYLCPIGQFNFIASTMSPLELRARDDGTCRSCRTVDCIKGRRLPTAPAVVVQRGCELNLFMPLKVGNLDCTLCLDCVHACPHDNIGLMSRLPGAELADSRRRSGIGWIGRRADIAALAALFVFGALLNAFAMVSPVYRLEASLASAIGVATEAPVLALVFFIALVIVPLVLLVSAAAITRAASGTDRPISRIATRYAFALVPFGFGMWLAHYGFHLLTAMFTVVPVTQSIVANALGRPLFGEPLWRWAGMRPGAVFPIELGCILLGAMGSLATAYRISERDYPERPLPATVPWAVVTVSLAAFAIWILSQPMEMRGTGFLG